MPWGRRTSSRIPSKNVSRWGAFEAYTDDGMRQAVTRDAGKGGGRVIPFPRSVQSAEVLARAAAGDVSAQSELYRDHASAFVGFLYRLCGDAQDAEDMAQEAFLTVFDRLHRVEEGRFRAYLYSVGVRKAQHLFRRRRLLRRLGLAPTGDDADVAEVARPDASPEDKAELAGVLQFMQQLPPSDRIAWCLRRIEGYTIDEAATLCECSPATLKRRIQRAESSWSTHAKKGADR